MPARRRAIPFFRVAVESPTKPKGERERERERALLPPFLVASTADLRFRVRTNFLHATSNFVSNCADLSPSYSPLRVYTFALTRGGVGKKNIPVAAVTGTTFLSRRVTFAHSNSSRERKLAFSRASRRNNIPRTAIYRSRCIVKWRPKRRTLVSFGLHAGDFLPASSTKPHTVIKAKNGLHRITAW